MSMTSLQFAEASLTEYGRRVARDEMSTAINEMVALVQRVVDQAEHLADGGCEDECEACEWARRDIETVRNGDRDELPLNLRLQVFHNTIDTTLEVLA